MFFQISGIGRNNMDLLLILLAITVAVRGLGAGIIYDVALVSLPLRHKIGVIPYVNYAQALFKDGFKTFFTISIIGAILTVVVTVDAFIQGASPIVSWSIALALIATIIAFIGTSRALPVISSLQKAPDDEVLLSKKLDKFARWHTFSTIWQVVAFITLIIAMVNQI